MTLPRAFPRCNGNGVHELVPLPGADDWPEDRRGDSWEPQENKHGIAAQPARTGYRFGAINSADFHQADYRPSWLISKLLVRGQPAVVGGPRKGMKTSLVVDLALSLATGTPFLGHFASGPPCRVLVASGESGPHTLQETARRICMAKGIGLATVENCFWDFSLPQLSRTSDLAELGAGLKRNAIDVAIIDPLYLALLGGSDAQASNMYDMGPLFAHVTRACLNVGATPILVHHFRQTRERQNGAEREPPDLGDLAFAGIQEFARQWLLVGRREPYEPGTGRHCLWLSAGGSIGHGGLWAVDVNEGSLGEDFTGRVWDVCVTTPGEVRETRKAQSAADSQRKKLESEQDEERRLMEAIDLLAPAGGAVGRTKARNSAALSETKADAAILRLIKQGLLEESPAFAPAGPGGKGQRSVPGIRRKPENRENRENRDRTGIEPLSRF